MRIFEARGEGFEPSCRDPESRILPLDDPRTTMGIF